MNNSIRFSLGLCLFAFASAASYAASGQEIFVRSKAGFETRTEQSLAKLGLHKVWSSSLVSGLARYEVPAAKSREATLSSLRSLSSILYAEPNYAERRHLPAMVPLTGDQISIMGAAPSDPMFSKQWALNNANGIQPDKAWDLSTGSSDIRVAVIDTGVDATHPDLQGKVVAGYDFIDNTANVTDHHGHGTHVSGIIGATMNNNVGISGINDKVTIIPIRAVPSDADETDANVISAFEFAVQQGARVANCSFGKHESSQAVADTIAAAGEKGLLVVVAAGNDGADNNQAAEYPANFRTPNMIVVASTSDQGKLSFFSNFGMGVVDLAAPGSGILSTIPNGQYASWSGTSMAAPQVAGVAALTLSINPKLTVSELREVLIKSVTQVPALQGKVSTGGRINAGAAADIALHY